MGIDASDQLGNVAVRLIQNVTFFKGLKPAELFDFLAKARQTVIRYNQVVFKEGDEESQAMYIIVKGAVEISKALPDGSHEVVGTLGSGQCFGEMALADRQPRSATATAKADTIVLAFTGDFLAAFPPIAFRLYENLARIIARRYLDTEHEMRGIMQPVCKVNCVDPIVGGMPPIAGSIGPRGLETLAQLGNLTAVPAAEYVVKENTVGQYMYVVFEGTLEVTQVIEGEPMRLALLQRGSYFGEVALVSDQHGRLADVRAVEDAKLLRLNNSHLEKAPHVGAVIYRELCRLFSVRLRRTTLVYMQTIGRSCHRDCPVLTR
ncbi:MAG TPA: cyclic nucleotide-binding domain-containing protein [Rhodocyclaceae bacterium]